MISMFIAMILIYNYIIIYNYKSLYIVMLDGEVAHSLHFVVVTPLNVE